MVFNSIETRLVYVAKARLLLFEIYIGDSGAMQAGGRLALQATLLKALDKVNTLDRQCTEDLIRVTNDLSIVKSRATEVDAWIRQSAELAMLDSAALNQAARVTAQKQVLAPLAVAIELKLPPRDAPPRDN